ncbi:MAG TPA: hypothetical protein VFD90_09325 [Gaiellales bacterium]|jgi:hypothetical protein|nr:hypothetical protein [Gaiellales bacterium]
MGELCVNDDPRGMLAWAVLNYDPHGNGVRDIDDQVAGLFVEIYARLSDLEDDKAVDRDETQRLLRDTDRLHEIVHTATSLRIAKRSA